MDRTPTVPEMINWLDDLVQWEPFGQLLPDMKPSFIQIIKRENRDYIAGQKIALYDKWLSVFPGATWKHVIDALENSKNIKLAQNVKDKLGIRGGEVAEGRAHKREVVVVERKEAMEIKATVCIDKIRRILKDVMRKKYVNLQKTMRDALVHVAGHLWSTGIIGETVQEAPSYDGLINGFQSCMDWKQSIEELDELCTNFLKSIASIGGPGIEAANNLATEWKNEVYEECHVTLRLNYNDDNK